MKKLSKEEIEEIRKDPIIADWYHFCGNYDLSEEFIREFKDYLNWWKLSYYQNLPESLIREFQDIVNWSNILSNQALSLSEAFLLEFIDKVDAFSFYFMENDKIPQELKDKIMAVIGLMKA
jgi:hypothetical protein